MILFKLLPHPAALTNNQIYPQIHKNLKKNHNFAEDSWNMDIVLTRKDANLLMDLTNYLKIIS
jgi:hypothetical protein